MPTAPPARGGRGGGGGPLATAGRRGAGSGRAGPALVEDVERDGRDEDEALDRLLPGGVDVHDREADVEHTHDERTDDGPGDLADTAGHRRPTDEGGGDGVELVVLAGGGDTR